MPTYKTNSPANPTDWVTPLGIVTSLGEFDLDPCCPPVMPWRTATTMFHEGERDGLTETWHGRVWLNPPYGSAADVWMEKLYRHGNGIALVPAAVETKRFQKFVYGKAHGLCLIYGRIHFHKPDGTRPKQSINQPCCLVAYGADNLNALHRCGLGAVVVPVTVPHN